MRETEISGPWHEIKSYLLSWPGTNKQKVFIDEIVAEVEDREQYQDNTVLTVDDFFDLLDLMSEKAKAGGHELSQVSSFISIASSKLYHGFRSKIASGAFDTSKDWPEADISSKNFNGKVQLAPELGPVIDNDAVVKMQEAMREKVIELSKQGDLAADVFDIVSAKWLREANSPESMINISVNEILEARGLKKRSRQGDSRSGHYEEQRAAVAKQIEILSYAWITVFEMDTTEMVKGRRKRTKWRGESKALNMSSRVGQVKIDGTMDPYLWHIRPGDVFSKFLFGPGRETALLSCKALQYDYYRQKWEKRLARYISWQWRITEQRKSWRVATLMEAIEETINQRFPKRTKDRLEKALDQLQADSIISSWKYERLDPDMTSQRGWWKQWQDCLITMTAPAELLQHYGGLIANRTKHKQIGGGKNGNKKQG